MILHYLYMLQYIFSQLFKSDNTIITLTTTQAIESVIEHYGNLPINKLSSSRFSNHKFPCKTFYRFGKIFDELVETIEEQKTPGILKIQTISPREDYYRSYFRTTWSKFIEPESVRKKVLSMLEVLNEKLSDVEKHQPALYGFYSARAEIALGYCVDILEIITDAA